MNAKETVAKRILELCNAQGIAVNLLANKTGIPPSTIYGMLNKKVKIPDIVSLQRICDDLDISLRDFLIVILLKILNKRSLNKEPCKCQ